MITRASIYAFTLALLYAMGVVWFVLMFVR